LAPCGAARRVGLAPKNKLVRASFSDPFKRYLKELDPWYDYLGNFRHSLAHRIPLYIPPYVLLTKNEVAYREVEQRMAIAISKRDFVEHERLSVEQLKLTSFKPWMQHSFGEKSRTVYFHPQMIADFNTVDEVGWKMLDELDRFRSASAA
jgi:hypothetical protein